LICIGCDKQDGATVAGESVQKEATDEKVVVDIVGDVQAGATELVGPELSYVLRSRLEGRRRCKACRDY